MTGSAWRKYLGSLACLATALAISPAIAQVRPMPGLSFTPFHRDGIYRRGEPAGWTVSVDKGAHIAPGAYHYTIREDDDRIIKSGTLDLSRGQAKIAITLDHPAMLYAQVSGPGSTLPGPSVTEQGELDQAIQNWVRDADPASKVILSKYPNYKLAPVSRANTAHPQEASIPLGAAVAPWAFKPSAQRPADFDAFWAAKLKALKQVPIHPVLTPVASHQPGVTLSEVQLDSLGSHVHGYLAKPDKPGKYPALIIYQYAGVYALQPAAATNRAANGWLTFDVDSHDLLPTQSKGVPNDYQTIGDTSRETSYFLKMYLRDTRAIDYIQSRPDWDGHTIVIMGTSMGGQQSLVTAGLNPHRVTAVIVNEPSGGDSNGPLHGHSSAYPFWNTTNPKIAHTALYFDTVNFASHIQAPTLAAMGFIDTTATPVSVWTALDQIPAPKEAIPMIESDHNNVTPQKQDAFYGRSEQVLANLLAGRKFVPNQRFTRPHALARK